MGCSSSVPIESGSSSPAGPSREPQGSSSGAASSKRAEAVKRDAVFDDIDEVDEDYVLPVIPKSAEALGRIRSACANLADSIFTGISDEQLEALFLAMELVPTKPGELIITQGTMGDRFYIVDSGDFEVCASPQARQPSLVFIISRFHYFYSHTLPFVRRF